MPKSIAGSCACEDFKALDKRKALQRLPQAFATKLREGGLGAGGAMRHHATPSPCLGTSAQHGACG